jgi:hypothetical protein
LRNKDGIDHQTLGVKSQDISVNHSKLLILHAAIGEMQFPRTQGREGRRDAAK